MTDSEHDDDFEAYLKRRVPIDQRLKGVDGLEPPPELDRIVIGKARNAIQNSPPVPLYRAPKWALPVGLAATLVIAFSIGLGLGFRSGRHQQLVESAPAVAAAPSSEPTAPPPPAPTVPSNSARQQTAPSGLAASAAAGGASSEASAKTFARMRPPPIKTAPWPPLPRAEKPAAPSDATSGEYAAATSSAAAEFDARSRSAERRIAEKRIRTDDSERVAAAADVGSAGAPTNAVPDVASTLANAPATRVAAAAAGPAPAAPPPRPLVDATANAAAPAPLRLAASSPKASAATFDGTKVIEPHSAERFEAATERPARESPAGTPGGLPAARAAAPAASSTTAPAAASSAGSSAADRHEHPDPKVWLDQIQKLRVAGLTAQAEQELKHFRDAYPGYRVAEQ